MKGSAPSLNLLSSFRGIALLLRICSTICSNLIPNTCVETKDIHLDSSLNWFFLNTRTEAGKTTLAPAGFINGLKGNSHSHKKI
jgi:hypothetical protein